MYHLDLSQALLLFVTHQQMMNKYNNNLNIYSKIQEEIQHNLTKYSFENLHEIINDYFQIEKENTFSIIERDENISIFVSFFDYKPQRKDEFNTLEVLIIKKDLIILSDEYSGLINNFFIDNKILLDILSEYGLSLIKPEEFVKKMN